MIGVRLNLNQNLVMTPQLALGLKVLAMNTAQLNEAIDAELNENPALEAYLGDDEWRPANSRDIGDELSDRDDLVSLSLADHLIRQVQIGEFNVVEREIAVRLINELDDRGYLTLVEGDREEAPAPLPSLSTIDRLKALRLSMQTKASREQLTIEHIAQELEYPAAWVQSVRRRLLLLDPGGCGAVSLQECLLAQVQIPSSVAGQVLSRCFTELENRDYRKVMKKLAIAPEDLSFALAQISRLEPVPARRHSISHEQTRTVVPDARIVKSGAEWVVLLNDDGLPKLRLSPLYKQQLKKKESSQTLQFVRAKVKSALWLIRCIHQRQNTLVKTITSIVRHQRAWFDGAPSLRPLVLKDIANDIAMHESTVSRATSGKWVETPRGIVELRYFFNSSESVRAAIKQIISQENRTAPLSDQEIVQTLTSQGITLARRTATKYRKQLGIGSKTDRRRAF